MPRNAWRPAGTAKNVYRSAMLLVPLCAGTAMLMSSCGGASDAAAKPTPTVSVTVPGPTATVTKTATVRITKTVTPTPEPTPEPTSEPAQADTAAPAPEEQEVGSDFDRPYAVAVVGDIITEIKTVDFRMRDGIGVSTRLGMLSDDYTRLSEAGTPPGTSPANYQARLSTLARFAGNAADDYDDDPTQGSATYAVVRNETAPLFAQLDSVLGTNFRLP